MNRKGRVLYIPHGGGPMPLLNDPGHATLIRFLRSIPDQLGHPEAILMVSAHWEQPIPTLTAGQNPPLIYDYGGFPPESYEIKYHAAGSPALAERIAAEFRDQGIPVNLDDKRGYDHGMFVPLKLMFPEADIPCLQLSLLNNLDASSHMAMGAALSSLVESNILVVGSGMSFHNLQSIFRPLPEGDVANREFEQWLEETCTGEMPETERAGRLEAWSRAPGGIACHPRPEHLLPLHVCYGIAQSKATQVFSGDVMGKMVSGYLWH